MRKIFGVLIVGLASACGPDWGDCQSCVKGEDSAESVDGSEQIPVINVVVNVDQTQSQNQSQSQSQTTPPTATGGVSGSGGTSGTGGTVGTGGSSGTGGKTGSGGITGSGGKCPPVCRKVCVKYETVTTCSKGTGDVCKNQCDAKTTKKCVKEETQCQ